LYHMEYAQSLQKSSVSLCDVMANSPWWSEGILTSGYE
jgi:hypothetical protein